MSNVDLHFLYTLKRRSQNTLEESRRASRRRQPDCSSRVIDGIRSCYWPSGHGRGWHGGSIIESPRGSGNLSTIPGNKSPFAGITFVSCDRVVLLSESCDRYRSREGDSAWHPIFLAQIAHSSGATARRPWDSRDGVRILATSH